MRRIGIIGGGRFGANLAEALAERGIEVLLLDRDRAVVDRMAGIAAKAMEGDATEEGTLEAAGFRDCDIAVVAVGSDMECSLLATLALKEMKVPHVIAKAANDMHGKVLARVGADRVVDLALVPVVRDGAFVRPTALRELIRACGPTITLPTEAPRLGPPARPTP